MCNNYCEFCGENTLDCEFQNYFDYFAKEILDYDFQETQPWYSFEDIKLAKTQEKVLDV